MNDQVRNKIVHQLIAHQSISETSSENWMESVVSGGIPFTVSEHVYMKPGGYNFKEAAFFNYLFKEEIGNIGQCFTPSSLPDFSNWGLPAYLGFTRCPAESTSNKIPGIYPRFYYGDALEPGDNGYWIKPDPKYKNKFVNYIETPAKINLMGNSYFYMEIEGLNNIDETNPYEDSTFTSTTNNTNGRVNSAFAKIAVSTTPVSQWYDTNTEAIKTDAITTPNGDSPANIATTIPA